MGDPKKKHKTYHTPKRPYDTQALLEELQTIGAYGLRNKRELWKAKTELSAIRGRARGLLSLEPEERAARERGLIAKLAKRGLVMENSRLEDVLTLSVEDLLERRLQTIVYRRGEKDHGPELPGLGERGGFHRVCRGKPLPEPRPPLEEGLGGRGSHGGGIRR